MTPQVWLASQVADCVVTTFASGVEFICRLQHLTRLGLAETALTDAGLVAICAHLKRLRALEISGTEVTDAGTLGLARLVDLEVLAMDTAGITNRSLANLASLPRLEKLDLFGAKYVAFPSAHCMCEWRLRADGSLTRQHHGQRTAALGAAAALARARDLQWEHQRPRRGADLQNLDAHVAQLEPEQVRRKQRLRPLCSCSRDTDRVVHRRNIHAKSLSYIRSLTELRSLNLSNTSISALSLRHLYCTCACV